MSNIAGGSTSLMHVLIVANLMRGPKSRMELQTETGVKQRTLDSYLKLLHDQGVIYIAEYRRQRMAQRPSMIYAMQRAPFEAPDAKRSAC